MLSENNLVLCAEEPCSKCLIVEQADASTIASLRPHFIRTTRRWRNTTASKLSMRTEKPRWPAYMSRDLGKK